jgi:hypothetical protein
MLQEGQDTKTNWPSVVMWLRLRLACADPVPVEASVHQYQGRELLHLDPWLTRHFSQKWLLLLCIFYWFTSHGTNNVHGFFRASFLKLLYSNCFSCGLISLFIVPVSLVQRRSCSNFSALLTEARILRYCTRGVLRTAGVTDRRTRLPRSHASGLGLFVVLRYRKPFLASILWTVTL